MNNMKDFKIEIKWAVIFSVVTLLWLVFEKMIGLHDQHLDNQMRYMAILGILYLALYYLGLRDKKVHFYGGSINFKEGLKFALVMSLATALLAIIVQYIFITVISPEYMPNMIKYMVAHGRFDQKSAENFYTMANQMKNSAYTNLVMGVFFGAISAALQKNKGIDS